MLGTTIWTKEQPFGLTGQSHARLLGFITLLVTESKAEFSSENLSINEVLDKLDDTENSNNDEAAHENEPRLSLVLSYGRE